MIRHTFHTPRITSNAPRRTPGTGRTTLSGLLLCAVIGCATTTSPSTTAPPLGTPEGRTTGHTKNAPTFSPVDPQTLRYPTALAQRAPASFRVRFDTSKGVFWVEVTRSWAPRGADRFYSLVTAGYFQEVRFFRVISRFMAQFGIHGEPEVNAAWREATIADDPVTQSNKRGTLTFATGGPNTRTTQLFINYGDNSSLDGNGFAPIGRVTAGMEVVDSLYHYYGEGAPKGRGPDQSRIQTEGNTYLKQGFKFLDYIKGATIEK